MYTASRVIRTELCREYKDKNEERMVMSIVCIREKSQIMKRKRKKKKPPKLPGKPKLGIGK
jgi:hypothetical protein